MSRSRAPAGYSSTDVVRERRGRAPYTLEPEELIETADDIVVLARFRGQGTGGGVPVDIPVAHIWTWREGRIGRARFFTDRAAALAAAGLGQ